MASFRMELPFTPSPFDCLAWSEDGLLAIAALEHVHIMVPRRPHPDDDASFPKWERIKIRVNEFSKEELASLQRPVADMMIGEQQNEATVAALAWSSPGLARHSRPALGVLTTDHVLSVWASAFDVAASTSWERVILINNSKSSFGRVRSMSWVPFRPEMLKNAQDRLKRGKMGGHVLVLGLETCKVVFLNIKSPPQAEGEWQNKTLHEIDLNGDDALQYRQDVDDNRLITRPSGYSLFADAMKTLQFIKDIELSPWEDHFIGDLMTTATFRGSDATHWSGAFRAKDDLSECTFGSLRDQNQSDKKTPLELRQRYEGPEGCRLMGVARCAHVLAVCVINLPHHSITFRGPAEETCTISFKFQDGHRRFPWQEPVNLNVKALEGILSTVTEPEYLQAFAYNRISLKILYAELMTCILIYDMKEDARRVTSFTKQRLQSDLYFPISSVQLSSRWDRMDNRNGWIVPYYARAHRLLQTIEHFSGNLPDERNLISELADENISSGGAPASNVTRAMAVTWNRGKRYHDDPEADEHSNALVEQCPVCTSPTTLAYKNLWVAICQAGHQFDRCKLTMLPILDLTWQKTCEDCGSCFINEHKHPDMSTPSTSDRGHVIGGEIQTRWTYFANQLFVEFDRCPYCKGNFTG